jgi:hypothetical protein
MRCEKAAQLTAEYIAAIEEIENSRTLKKLDKERTQERYLVAVSSWLYHRQRCPNCKVIDLPATNNST